ncbi:hypothetical protein NKG05_09860 [Oerskovia sp. M15]
MIRQGREAFINQATAAGMSQDAINQGLQPVMLSQAVPSGTVTAQLAEGVRTLLRSGAELAFRPVSVQIGRREFAVAGAGRQQPAVFRGTEVDRIEQLRQSAALVARCADAAVVAEVGSMPFVGVDLICDHYDALPFIAPPVELLLWTHRLHTGSDDGERPSASASAGERGRI